MSKELTFLQQLQMLKAMTVRTTAIHEAQTLQLRNYPLLIPSVRTATTSIDTEHKIVYYYCTSKNERFRVTKKVKEMCNNIYRWVTTILWDETAVVISVNNQTIYDSRAQK